MRIQPIFCTPINKINFRSSNRAEEDIRKEEDELRKEENEIKKHVIYDDNCSNWYFRF